MKSGFLAAFAIGIAVIAIGVAGVFYMQRNARVGLVGSILKVRTAPLDEKSAVVVLDFRFANNSDVLFQVRNVTVVMEDKAGHQVEGRTVSEIDAKRLFEALPILGQKFNDTLVMRDRVAARTSQDRMVASRFEVPESALETRKRFLLRVEDVDGPISELPEAGRL